MDAIDGRIINALQGGFPISDRPYAEAAEGLGISEAELIRRLRDMLAEGVLTRFGPLFHAERLGGGLTLAAMAVPEDRFDAVAETVNAHPEVAHNYARDHAFNMWFVLATDTPERIDAVIADIESKTDLSVYSMPKIDEFFIGLRFEA